MATPYRHAILSSVFSDARARALGRWLEREADWYHHAEGFYEQLECNLLRQRPQADGQPLLPEFVVDELKGTVSTVFGVPLSRRLTIIAHCMLRGYAIGAHNDAPSLGSETHRLVVQLTSPDHGTQGGELLVLREQSLSAVARTVPNSWNCGFAFELSSGSWHAVLPITAGKRTTLVLSFWSEAAAGFCDLVAPEVPWLDEFAKPHLALLRALGAERIAHSNADLSSHLLGTARLLAHWEYGRDVVLGGLLHSLYGTHSFQGIVPPTERARLQEILAPRVEQLAWRFGTLSGAQSLEALAQDTDFESLLGIHFANTVEQLPRVEAHADAAARALAPYVQLEHALRPKARHALRALLVATGR